MSKTYSHSEVMDLIHKCKESERLIWREKLEEKNERIEELEEKTKSQKLMYEEEIQEIAYAVKIWPSELQQLQWSPGGLRDAIIERIKSGVGRDEYF